MNCYDTEKCAFDDVTAKKKSPSRRNEVRREGMTHDFGSSGSY